MGFRFLPGSALVAVQVFALPTVGAAQGMEGAWCHPDWGAALFWEERSLGLGEHRICDWQDPPAGRTKFSTTIHCRSIYLNGEEVVEIDHKSHQFHAEMRADGSLRIRFDEDDPVDMTRC